MLKTVSPVVTLEIFKHTKKPMAMTAMGFERSSTG